MSGSLGVRSLLLVTCSALLLGACSEESPQQATRSTAASDLLLLAKDVTAVGKLQQRLSDAGFRVRTSPIDNVNAETSIPNGQLVVVAGIPGDRWQQNKALWKVLEGKKVIAMGKYGYDFLGLGKLRIGARYGWHNDRLPKIVRVPSSLQATELANLLTEPLAVEARKDDKGAIVTVYEGGGQLSHAAIYQGKKGFPSSVVPIGMEGAEGRHWIICKQGNYVLWGVDPDFDRITEAGARLFVNLCVAMSRAQAE